MGFIIVSQQEFLRFEPENNTNTVIACFITAVLEIGIFGGITYWEGKQAAGGVSQPEYLKFDEERSARQRESSMKGVAMVDLKGIRREQPSHEEEEMHDN